MYVYTRKLANEASEMVQGTGQGTQASLTGWKPGSTAWVGDGFGDLPEGESEQGQINLN